MGESNSRKFYRLGLRSGAGVWLAVSVLLGSPAALHAQPAKKGKAAAAASASVETSAAAPDTDVASTNPDVVPATDAAQSVAAPADPVALCVENHTQGQVLRKSDKLLESREQFRQCTLTTCPEFIRRDCLAWSDEMRAEIPTVSLRVTVDGRVRTDAAVTVDGAAIDSALDGRSLEMNPGIHQLHFELAGYKANDQEIILSVGERFRVISAALEAIESKAVAAPQTAPVAGPSAPPPAVERPIPMLTYVFLGTGAASAISAVAFGLATNSAERALEKSCAPNCSDHQIQIARQRALWSDISSGVSVASFVAAGALYLLRPERPLEQPVAFDVTSVGKTGFLGTVRFQLE